MALVPLVEPPHPVQGVRPALQVGQAISGTICLFGEAAACAGTSHTPVRLRQILGDGQRVPFHVAEIRLAATDHALLEPDATAEQVRLVVHDLAQFRQLVVYDPELAG